MNIRKYIQLKTGTPSKLYRVWASNPKTLKQIWIDTLAKLFQIDSSPLSVFASELQSLNSLFAASATFSIQQLIKLNQAFNTKHKTQKKIAILMELAPNPTDWVRSLKFMMVMCYLLRTSPESLSQAVLNYLSIEAKSQPKTPQQGKPLANLSSTAMVQAVRKNLILNLRMYIQKVCKDFKTYQDAWRGVWDRTSIHMLFSVVNLCNYLIATKSTFIKLFQQFDSTQIFSVIFRLVVEELAVWYKYYNSQLQCALQNSKQLEECQLRTMEQLVEESKRLHVKIKQFVNTATIHNIKINSVDVKPLKIPVGYRIDAERRKSRQDMKPSKQLVKSIIKIQSQERSFRQDELESTAANRSLMRESKPANRSVLVRPFKCQL